MEKRMKPAKNEVKSGFVSGQIDIKVVISVIFGCIFITAILILITIDKSPTNAALLIYKVVIALSAAGMAAILPGFLDVKFKSVIQSGGALAVFVLVLFAIPWPTAGAAGSQAVVPSVDAESFALDYMKLTDSGDYLAAYHATDPLQHYKWDQFRRAFEAGRAPMGKLIWRKFIGSANLTSPPGAPEGYYQGITYRVKYEHDSACRQENVLLRGLSESAWVVASYTVTPIEIPC
jgi:Protein of unknown function (DUF4019)